MTPVNIPVLFAQPTGRMCHSLLMCVHFDKFIAIPELDFFITDNIRETGHLPERIRCITQIIDEHTEKTRQKAREGSRGEAGRTKATSCRTGPHRGPQTGERSKEATEESQGCVEAGSGTPAHAGKAGSERKDGVAHGSRCVMDRVLCYFRSILPSFTIPHHSRTFSFPRRTTTGLCM